MMKVLLFGLVGYYFIELLDYWIVLGAALRSKLPQFPPNLKESDAKPRLVVVAPCRDSAKCIPGLVQCLRAQTYPRDRYRIVVLADNCTDNSAEVARSLGVEVYERRDSVIKTKGAALNEWLHQHMRDESFDAMTILDIDSRVKPDFLSRVAAYVFHGANVTQTMYMSKNCEDSSISRIGDAAHTLILTNQRGRAALGLSACLSGSGLTISRTVLDRMGWYLGTGHHLGEDVEFNIRCRLNNIFVNFAMDQPVWIDLPQDMKELRYQRRRWSMSPIQLVISYFWPLSRKVMSGDWRTLEMIFSTFFALPFSLLFVAATISMFSFALVHQKFPSVIPLLGVISFLWITHGLYYVVALHGKIRNLLNLKDFGGLLAYLAVRIFTVCEATFLVLFSRKIRWIPTPHRETDTGHPDQKGGANRIER